jgi:hypothetical protein
MKCLRFLVLLMIGVITLSGGIAYADSPSVDDVKVYQDYKDAGDWLIVAVYNISGTNASTSQCGSNYPWIAQLIDNSDASIVGNWRIKLCGMRPIGLYLSAMAASSETVGGNYSIKVLAQWGAAPSGTKLISATDWKGANYDGIGGLDEWVINEAKIMETYDGITYVETVAYPEYAEVLNTNGGGWFATGIDALDYYRPDLFIVNIENYPIDYVPPVVGDSYAADLYNNWDDSLGPEIAPALTDIGFYFGVNGRMMAAILTLVGFLSIVMIEKSIAVIIILGGVLIGVIPMATVIMLVFILVIVLIRSLFWSST